MAGGTSYPTDSGWIVEQVFGSTQSLHDDVADFAHRLIRVNEIKSPSLVLGSTQDSSLIDRDRAEESGIEIAKRHSGGGIVSMIPGSQCWIDVYIPAADPLWVDDVSRSSHWLGEAWAQVAAGFGWNDAAVHRGPLSDPALAKLICFGALGSGEVAQDGQKLVGISQRRTRLGARFQCIVYLEWDPTLIFEFVDLEPFREQAREILQSGVAPISGDVVVDGWSVVERLLDRLR